MRRGFTLIEIMICIALLAITMAVTSYAWMGLGQLRHEGQERASLRNARQQLLRLEKAPFGSLPPERLRVNRKGYLRTSQTELVPLTVGLRRMDGTLAEVHALQVNAAAGQIQVDAGLAGQDLLVDYRWNLPELDEAQVVGEGGRTRLEQAPARRIVAVRLVQGERVTPVRGWRLSADRASVELPPALAGRAVLIDYYSQHAANQAGGRFLDETLQLLDVPSPLKLVELVQGGGDRPGQLRFSTLRVNS